MLLGIVVNSSFGFQQTLESPLLTSGPERGYSRSQKEQTAGLNGLQRRVKQYQNEAGCKGDAELAFPSP